jgi:hypothetical protein
MATGITTSTTQADIDIIVVIPELNAGLRIPGVAPNAELALVAADTSSGLVTSVTTPELATNTNTNAGLTTTENIEATEITLGKFVRGLDALSLKNPIYNTVGKILGDATNSITDIFNRRVRYIRDITDPIKPTTENITFFVNKGAEDKTALQDLLNTFVIYGRSFIDVTNFIDAGINYSLSTKYADIVTVSESAILKLRFIRSITGQEIPVLSDLEINKRISSVRIDNTTVGEALTKTVNVNLIESKLTYISSAYYSLLKLLTDNFNSIVRVVIVPYKQVNDSLVLQDSYRYIWNSFRNILEIKTIAEATQFNSSLQKYDTANIIESFGKKLKLPANDYNQALDIFNRQVSYRRIVTDILHTTDDYYGLANVDDDQYAGFYKQIRDSLVTQETFIRAVAATLINIADVSDPFFRIASYNRIFAGNTETVNKFDTISSNSKIPKFDTILKQDYYSRIANFYRKINETKSLFEQKLISISKRIIDSISNTLDTKLLVYGYIANEIATAIHIFNRQVNYRRIFTDILHTTDDYYGLANVDDDQYAGFYKQTRDYLTFQESKPIKSVSITATPSIADISDPYISIAVFNRAFTDSTNSSDTISKNFKAIKFDVILSQDYYSRIANFYRAVNDTQSLLEQKTLYIRSFLANAGASAIDKNLIFLRKYLNTETIIGTDSNYTRTNFIRNITDYVDATDDYYGLANIDDDQYARVNKGIVDTISLAEKVTPVSFTFYNPLAESYTTNQELRIFVRKFPSVDIANIDNIEYTSIKVNKRANNEIFYNYDASTRYANRVLQDAISFSFSDSTIVTRAVAQRFLETLKTTNTNIKLNPKKVIRDTKTVFDFYFYRVTYGRELLEILSINSSSDKKYIRVGKSIKDIPRISESIQRVLAIYFKLYDTVHLTDDYYGLANVDDDQYARVNKKFNDSYTARDYLKYSGSVKFTDIFNKTDRVALKVRLPRVDSTQFAETFVYSKYSRIDRVFTDQILKSNSGLINNQNYFADKYVAPGYAGTNRTIF